MTDVAKISSCVDCTTTIIGERFRCPACHDQHTASLLASDEDATLPRDRSRPKTSIWMPMFGAVQLVTIVVILVILAAKGCL